MVNPGTPSIAVDQVNHVGEIVAVVVARSRKAEAQDALEAIEVDYEPLPPVLDMEAAVTDGADLVHPNTESNQSLHLGVRVRRGRHRRADPARRSTTPRSPSSAGSSSSG